VRNFRCQPGNMKWVIYVYKLTLFLAAQLRRWRLSLFEKVILANCIMLIGEALAGLWVTSHNIEAHHYLIDTGFLVAATLLGLSINIILLRASFRPLFALLATIRAISSGKTQARAPVSLSDAEISELARAFNSMLDRLETIRREQAGLILQAQEEERRRLALELHDESSQNLTALLVHIEILSQGLQAAALTPAARGQLESGLEYLAGLSQRTLENIRVLAQQLRPSVLDDHGLCAALRWLAEDGRQRLQLFVQLDLDGAEEALHTCAYPATYETALFRIAQEGLTNVARHAHAQRACITLGQKAGHISLAIRDDGRGYDPSRHHEGLGIFGMRERAMLLGGTIEIQTQPGHGTTVQATLPWPASIEEVKNA
jgi:two-component system sensor histidine kinase UhpB